MVSPLPIRIRGGIVRDSTLVRLLYNSAPGGLLKEREDRDELGGRYLKAILRGDGAEAAGLLQEALLCFGSSNLYEELFVPAMANIGDLWCRGEINIAREHLATQIMLGHLERLRQSVRPKERLPLRIVISTVETDFHTLGARIAADLFHFDGWQVDFLGANTPTRDLVEYVAQRESEVVGLSGTVSQSVKVAAEAIARLKALKHKPLVILGGRISLSKAASTLGADLLAPAAVPAVVETRRLLGLDKPEGGLDGYLESLGRRIQALRKARGWSQRTLAQTAGLDRTYVSSVEHGKQNLTLSVALKLAEALSVPLEWLLTERLGEIASHGRDLFV